MSFLDFTPLAIGEPDFAHLGAFDSAKNRKRQRRKRQRP